MKLKDITFATQYYRSPTPLKEEWETDLINMKKYGLNTIQIRINWRNNERKENVYDFSDIDSLIKLAEKHNKKIIIKFLLECAPQYIFDKYNGTKIGPKGELIRGGSHGAFYAGGWSPCFTNPKVKERMVKFVKEVVKRYHNHSSIIMWNAWNEPRNKPVEDCFCPSCRKAFGEYLKAKFKTIDNLNKFYGVCEESFEHIALPSMPHGYWDIFEFKKFKSGIDIYNRLKAVYDAIRVYDKKRPIISHSGYPSAFQSSLGDCLDDYKVKTAVDMWGSSLPIDTKMDNEINRLDYQMLLDFLKALDKDFYLYEIYPGLGMFKYSYDDEFDMSYKLYSGLFSGAKGFNFWQYRSERVGHEADCAGLTRVDGTPRKVLTSVKDFSDTLSIVKKDIINYEVKKNDIAILFDYDSNLISEIEDASGKDYCFENYWNINYYQKSHSGFYRLLKRNNFGADYLFTGDISKIHKYKFVYVPYYPMIEDNVKKELIKFVNNGGTLFLDEGFGLRDLNTWLTTKDINLKPLINTRLDERRYKENEIILDNDKCRILGYYSTYISKDSKSIIKFSNKSTALSLFKYKKGSIYLSGFSLGYNALANKAFDDVIISMLKKINIKRIEYSNFNKGIEVKALVNDNNEYLLIYNTSESSKIIFLKDKCIDIKTNKRLNKLNLKSKEFIILRK